MAPSTELEMFAISAPGIEHLTLDELKGLGVKQPEAGRGGVTFRGTHETLYAANLWLRTATRILVRIARFHAASFSELERRASKIPWPNFVGAIGRQGGDAGSGNSAATFRVTCHKSRLYHSDAVAERLLRASGCTAGKKIIRRSPAADADEAGMSEDSQLFIVRLERDELTISADSSGALLHRRGYRPEATRAPLRETLAAAMLLASHWKPGIPLLDPLCGSGTIPIEAAMIALNIAPGNSRSFVFQQWPSFDAGVWKRLRDKAERGRRTVVQSDITGSDRDAGAIEIANRNATRAGVGGSVNFQRRSLTQSLTELAQSTDGPACIVTNPPYGVRVAGGASLRNLYATLAASTAAREDWSLGILTPDDKLVRQSGAALERAFRTRNGGIPVTFFTSRNDDPAIGDES